MKLWLLKLKDSEELEKVGDSTIRVEMTMPKSPVMGESAVAKSLDYEEKETLVISITMVKDIKQEKEKKLPFFHRKNFIQSGVDRLV